VVCLLISLAGCGDNLGLIPPESATGTVVVDPSPDLLYAPWTLTGPDDFIRSSDGDDVFERVAPGTYTITWGQVDGYITPAVESQSLQPNSTVTFSGNYVAGGGTGTIVIHQIPDDLAGAGWSLVGPQSETGSGSTTLGDMPVGDYLVVWTDVSGYAIPISTPQTLDDNETITFVGEYVEAGTIQIFQTPADLPAAGWSLTGPLGFAETGSGNATLTRVPVGDYTLSWAEVVAYTTPPDSTQTLEADGVITFSGTYEVALGTIVINQTPDGLPGASWTLSGPLGYEETGSGDASLPYLPVGLYTLTWGAVSGYLKPPALTLGVAMNAATTFPGTYVQVGNFVLCEGGTFTMGSPTDEPRRIADEAQHQVTLSRNVYIQTTEVTNRQYLELAQWAVESGHAMVTSDNLYDNVDSSVQVLLRLSSSFCEIEYVNGVFRTDYPNRPVQEVTWYGAAAYCDWINKHEELPLAYDHRDWRCNDGDPYGAVGYRLPTEAEWEFACRAGGAAAFANGPITSFDCSPIEPNLNLLGWYCGNAGASAHSVAQKGPNDWGLYDMHGNLWEWCNDWYGSYGGDATDPVGPSLGEYRVIRGGAWNTYAQWCRSAFRRGWSVSGSYNCVGFRTVRTAE